jgi:hypothetical protein
VPDDDTTDVQTPDETPPQALDRAAFLATLRLPPEERVVCGCRVRGLTDEAYQQLQIMRASNITGSDDLDRTKQCKLRERAAYLALGVVEPVIDFEQWLVELGSARAAVIEEIVQAIMEITGVDSLEVGIAKKLLAATQGGTLS